MRTLLVSFLAIVFMTSIVSAELLTTANPLGQGVWAFEVAGIQDQTLGNIDKATLTTIGGYLAYGVTDSLNAYLQVGSSTSSGLNFGTPDDTAVTGTGYGLNLKYTVLNEMNGAPVSVAIGGGYKTTSQTAKTPGFPIPFPPFYYPTSETTAKGSEILLGVGASKIMVPFIPYCALSFRQQAEEGEKVAGQYDLTVGTAILWSKQGAVFVEYTSQAIAPEGANGYTSAQVALGVAYALR